MNLRKDVLALMESVLELPAEERSAFLDKRCRDNPQLLEAVLARLELDSAVAPDGPLIKDDDPVGGKIGPYEIVRSLGAGGMGAVYLATREDDHIRMSVAVKLIRRHLAYGDFQARFRQERQLLADLKHPHIAMLLDAGSYQDRPYFMMEYIEGQTIDKWCLEHKVGLVQLLQIFRRVVAAVGYAHSKGVIHRDIKPGNIMVTHGEPKLLDFGIARLTQISNDGPATHAMTPEYAAPEQARGQVVTEPSDIYSLGLLLLQLLTGKRPSQMGKTPIEAIDDFSEATTQSVGSGPQVNVNTIELPDTLKNEIPDALCHILRTALADDLAFRYPSAAKLLADLDRLISILPKPVNDTEKRYDVVFWHHEDNLPVVANLAAELEKFGLRLFPINHQQSDTFTSRAISALAETRACLVCAGPNKTYPWHHDTAFRDCLSFMSDQLRILPVLLPDTPFPDKHGKLPAFLRDQPWQTFPTGITADAVQKLIAAIRSEDGQIQPTQLGVCPFRGLEVFREQDRAFFYGRESVTQRITAHLSTNQFICVLGPSGTGKSSVVQAGVIPSMREQGYQIALFSPTNRPLSKLAQVLCGLFPDSPSTPSADLLRSRLADHESALHVIGLELMSVSDGARLLLVIDQFEELFTIAEPDESNQFIANLCHVMDQPYGAIQGVVTMRSDFLGHCAAHADLNTHLLENALQIPAMSRDHLSVAIESPSRLAGLELEAGLLERILADLSDDLSELPLLEYALLELYQHRRDNVLLLSTYQKIGGIEGALAGRAEQEFLKLSSDDQELLRKVFTSCLIQPGEGTEDTRRRSSYEEIMALDQDEDRIAGILTQWADVRLLTLSLDTQREIEQVDVAHEALIRKWPRINEWMNVDRDHARLVNRLRTITKAWLESGRDEDLLLRGAPLQQMLELQTNNLLSPTLLEQEYLDCGVQLMQQQYLDRRHTEKDLKVRKNIAQTAGLVAMMLAIVASVLYIRATRAEHDAVLSANRAEHQRAVAVEARDTAERKAEESNYNLSLALNEKAEAALASGDPRRSWLYSLAALSRELPASKTLPEAAGRLNDPRTASAFGLLWTSPIAPPGHTAISPDNTTMAVIGAAGVHLIDLETGVQTAVLEQSRRYPMVPVFSPNGMLLASGSFQDEQYIWRLDDQSLKVHTGHRGQVGAIAFDDEGQMIASGDAYGRLIIRDAQSGEIFLERDGHGVRHGGIEHLLFTDTYLLVASGDGSLIQLDRNSFERKILRNPGEHPLNGLVHAAAGRPAYITGAELVLLNNLGEISNSFHTGKLMTRMAAAPNSDTFILTARDTPLIYWEQGHMRELNPDWRVLDYPPLSFDGDIITGRFRDGRLLRAGVTDNKLQGQMVGHNRQVNALAWSPDDSVLASGSIDGAIILWDQERDSHRTIEAGAGYVGSLAFSNRGELLAAGMNKKVLIWQTDLLQNEPHEISFDENQIKSLAFSPDDSKLAIAADSKIKIWNGPDKEMQTLKGHKDRVTRVAFSPDGDRLATASTDRTVKIWDLNKGKTIHTLKGHQAVITDVAWSGDGNLLATTSYDNTVRLWRDNKSEIIYKGDQPVFLVVFSQNDQLTYYDGAFIRSSHLNGAITMELIAPMEKGRDMVLSHDKTRLATGGSNLGDFQIWSASSRRKDDQFVTLDETIGVHQFSPDGDQLALTTGSKLHVIHPQVSNSPVLLGSHPKRIMDLSYSSDGSQLASASYDGVVRFWDAKTGAATGQFLGKGSRVQAIHFLPDSNKLVYASGENSLRIYDNGVESELIRHDMEKFVRIRLSPSGKWLASVTQRAEIHVLSPQEPSQRSIWGYFAGQSISDMHFSPDNSKIAISYDRVVAILDVASGLKSMDMEADGKVSGVAFSPDNKWIVAIADTQKLILWNAQTGERAFVVGGDWNTNGYPRFSPDGSTIAAQYGDSELHLQAMSGFLVPPRGMPSHRWYQEILDRSLYQMGYHLDGFQLEPLPHARLQGLARELSSGPWDHLDHPKPLEVDYLDWLMNRQPAKTPRQ